MDADTGQAPASIPATGYAFHDPCFVTWWLNSLYLFPLEDQIAIAQLLRSAVHAALPRQEIDAFIEFQASARQAEEDTVDKSTALSRVETDADLRWQLRSAWRRRPWLTSFGVLSGVYFVGKGAWFLQQFMRSVG